MKIISLRHGATRSLKIWNCLFGALVNSTESKHQPVYSRSAKTGLIPFGEALRCQWKFAHRGGHKRIIKGFTHIP